MFALPFTKAAREKKRRKVIIKTTREFIYAHEYTLSLHDALPIWKSVV